MSLETDCDARQLRSSSRPVQRVRKGVRRKEGRVEGIGKMVDESKRGALMGEIKEMQGRC